MDKPGLGSFMVEDCIICLSVIKDIKQSSILGWGAVQLVRLAV